ncbi:hypothetical protein [Streptomyces sp. NEAU-YJ-81]|uniref:hypothetical protein n=1 Tax=Streptomyces sp. NEAU-YJ-81 TaxID=2820288 RepID=UPI0035AF209C
MAAVAVAAVTGNNRARRVNNTVTPVRVLERLRMGHLLRGVRWPSGAVRCRAVMPGVCGVPCAVRAPAGLGVSLPSGERG